MQLDSACHKRFCISYVENYYSMKWKHISAIKILISNKFIRKKNNKIITIIF